jgi:hypothetical protein
LRPVHLGDAISFVINVAFEPAQVRVQTLDDEFFKRAFAGPGNLQLYARPTVTQTSESDGRVRIRVVWPFQILGCPEQLPTCPGNKHYELPVVSVSYQLIGDSGEVVNDKSARFRPWPGKITLTPTLAIQNGQGGEFGEFFPGGAHAEPLPIDGSPGAGTVAMLAGILLVVVGLNRRRSGDGTSRPSPEPASNANRWQQALAGLQNQDLPDDQWADLLRRCASWYCIDELGRNPHTPLATEFDRFFADLLNEASISAGSRSDFLGRFLNITGEVS